MKTAAIVCFVLAASAATAQFLQTTIELPDSLHPIKLCYNDISNKLYCLGEWGDIAIVDGINNSVLATVPAGDDPRALCFNPVHNRVYCANAGSDDVTVIDGRTDEVVATVRVGEHPASLCYCPAGNRIFCSNLAGHTVAVINGATARNFRGSH